MCSTCGCGTDQVRVTSVVHAHDHDLDHGHDHAHDHEREHQHHHDQPEPASELRTHRLDLEQRILLKNDELADANRRWLAERDLRAVNLMSSPGAGKTSLLERTIRASDRAVTVIEGDQETLFDAERIRAAGARAVQVNTGAGCHLDAAMVQRALEEVAPRRGSVVFIENVGNLVCPALFDLGESRKVVVVSVTEGDDKPLKYPHMFAAAQLVVLNKTDLLPHVDFDVDRFVTDARKLNPGVDVLPMSVRTGDGFDAWQDWLRRL